MTGLFVHLENYELTQFFCLADILAYHFLSACLLYMLQFLLEAAPVSHKPHRCVLDVPLYGNTRSNTPIAPVGGWRRTATTPSHYIKFFSAKAYHVSEAPQFLSLSISGFLTVPSSSVCLSIPPFHTAVIFQSQSESHHGNHTGHTHALQFVLHIKCSGASLRQMNDEYEVECACVSERVHLSTDGSLI